MSWNGQGVILAAGVGERVKSSGLPKLRPMLPIGNKPIIQHQIESMKKLGIEEVIIVVGYQKDQIVDFFKDGKHLGVKIKYIEQEKTLGIAHVVGQLEPYIKKPFILFLGDVFFYPKNWESLIDIFEKQNATAVLAVKKDTNPKFKGLHFAVLLHDSGLVRRVIEKPRHTVSPLKGCGIYVFDISIFDAIRRTPRTAMRDEYEITDSIQILIDDGYPIYSAEVVDWYVNVTSPSDLLLCNLKYLAQNKVQNIIGEGTKICSGAIIENSVVGNNVIIEKPLKMREAIVFDDVRLIGGKGCSKVIVTTNGEIPCDIDESRLNE
ncbi:MAG: hypothetical protein A2149_09070 [Candidatus Schekmanbacteria bacterium RBG_16_38_11]|uniref:Uncharacterized protein n=1 Tax=Candidatus Schekmanbacteria bacterium RBG_16_38_11 TaxID=1817880 RepID=A0A1F7RXJ3_9BACT|nr:MAG: hypothetical protein A2149_09070 [Candidatus Schekmanbacteria bacterium RBG_16_38_11]